MFVRSLDPQPSLTVRLAHAHSPAGCARRECCSLTPLSLLCIVSLLHPGSGGPSPHLQCAGGAPQRQNQSPPIGHVRGDPWPREYVELIKDRQHVTLAPVEFHETFTIMFALVNYSWREWVRYFTAEVSAAGQNTTDLIQVNGYQRVDDSGLFFLLSRDGYDVAECVVEVKALVARRWQHITASVDHAGIMRLYIDGELRSSHQSKFTPRRAVRDQNKMGAKATDGRSLQPAAACAQRPSFTDRLLADSSLLFVLCLLPCASASARGSSNDENMNGAIGHLRIYNDACLTGDQVFHEYLKWQSANRA
jgi:hypothetical protein